MAQSLCNANLSSPVSVSYCTYLSLHFNCMYEFNCHCHAKSLTDRLADIQLLSPSTTHYYETSLRASPNNPWCRAAPQVL